MKNEYYAVYKQDRLIAVQKTIDISQFHPRFPLEGEEGTGFVIEDGRRAQYLRGQSAREQQN